jgi:hypothetical protein
MILLEKRCPSLQKTPPLDDTLFMSPYVGISIMLATLTARITGSRGSGNEE